MANKLDNRPNLVIYLINTVNSQGFIRKSFREKLIRNKKTKTKNMFTKQLTYIALIAVIGNALDLDADAGNALDLDADA